MARSHKRTPKKRKPGLVVRRSPVGPVKSNSTDVSIATDFELQSVLTATWWRAAWNEQKQILRDLLADLREGRQALRLISNVSREVSAAWRDNCRANSPLWTLPIMVLLVASGIGTEWISSFGLAYGSSPTTEPLTDAIRAIASSGPLFVLLGASIAIKLFISGMLLFLPSPLALVIALANAVANAFVHYDARLLAMLAHSVPTVRQPDFQQFFDQWSWIGLAYAALYPVTLFLSGSVQQAAILLPRLSIRNDIPTSVRVADWRKAAAAYRSQKRTLGWFVRGILGGPPILR